MEYGEFLAGKNRTFTGCGIQIDQSAVSPVLFPFQRDIVVWAAHKGRCAVFADTGLGKTGIQVEWARLMGQNTLIIAPLSVARQTVRIARDLLGIEVRYVRHGSDVTGDHKLWITNYEMIDAFDFSRFGAVILDESAILKAIDSKTRAALVEQCKEIPYRLCCTATPAPNDYIELGNHAHFLGICTMQEMLAMFFINANKEMSFVWEGTVYSKKGPNSGGTEWRLKRHAHQPFFRWLSSWSMMLTRPSDLGYDDDGFILPPLTITPVYVESNLTPTDRLLFTHLEGIGHRAAVRRDTLADKLTKLHDIMATDSGQWIVWVGLEAESRAVTDAIQGSVEVKGSDSPEYKAQAFEDFQDGKFQVLVTKGKIGGLGMNFQNAANMLFFGLNDSWETWYQCIRREWRFGQTKPVNVYVLMADVESEVYANIQRKEAAAMKLRAGMIGMIRGYELDEIKERTTVQAEYKERIASGKDWTLYNADSCVKLGELANNSIDLSIYSPPFDDLFTYSNSERDLGNNRNTVEFLEHYAFIIREMLRVTKPGRLTCVHTSDIAAMSQKDGYIGVKDFPGDVIRAYQKEGWTWVGRALVQKNPQALRNGTKVLTPKGWCAIEDIRIGDCVVGADGKATTVIGVWPQGKRDLYRVTFSDGVFVDCDAQHLWSVRPYGRKSHKNAIQYKTMKTADIAQNVQTPTGGARYDIPRVKPVMFDAALLPLHPYVLGVLLGDGCISQRSTIEFMAEPEIAERVAGLLSAPLRVVTREYGEKGGVGRHTIVSDRWHDNPALDSLRGLGLQGKCAWDKHIPRTYLFASPDDRLALLRGLMDTDGTCKKNGQAYFATCSRSLADGVVEIVQSMGGLASIKEENAFYTYKGQVLSGRLRYLVTVNMDIVPFALTRKVQRWHQKRETMRRIVSVEPVVEDECTCITVANLDGMFVTEGYVLTHNSQAIRIHASSLLFVQMRADSTKSRPALVDHVLFFKKDGENEVPVTPVQNGEMTNERWIEWANGIWVDIRETDTLQYAEARKGEHDDKHVCPLQLETIKRCMMLYSNPGELVLDPFAGISSTGYMALRLGRRFIGVELKPSYYDMAVKYLNEAENEKGRASLFDDIA